MKYLFENFLKDKNIYLKNIEFWKKLVEKIIKHKNLTQEVFYEDDLNRRQDWFWDGNPIFVCHIKSLNKQLRIIQNENDNEDTIQFRMWFDIREDENDKKVKEMTLVLESNPYTMGLATNAIYLWFLNNLSMNKMKDYLKMLIDSRDFVISEYNQQHNTQMKR